MQHPTGWVDFPRSTVAFEEGFWLGGCALCLPGATAMARWLSVSTVRAREGLETDSQASPAEVYLGWRPATSPPFHHHGVDREKEPPVRDRASRPPAAAPGSALEGRVAVPSGPRLRSIRSGATPPVASPTGPHRHFGGAEGDLGLSQPLSDAPRSRSKSHCPTTPARTAADWHARCHPSSRSCTARDRRGRARSR
jgi:hypothetical protein